MSSEPETGVISMNLAFGTRHDVVTQEAIDGLVGNELTVEITPGVKKEGTVIAAEPGPAPHYVHVTVRYLL